MKLKEIYRQIVSLGDYKPSEKVDRLFSALVLKAVDHSDIDMLTKKECGCLQKICSHAEYEMEKHWAKKIISDDKSLADFPYYENYINLTRLEWNALSSCSDHTRHAVLFVGSGPLPMTAIILAIKHKTKVTIIDNDLDAIKLSRKVIGKLGLRHMINILHADGNSFNGYEDFNVIFVAALAGTNPKQKKNIFKYISRKASKKCHVVARSSWGKRKLLYPPLPRSIYSLFKPIIEISPYNEIVNSVVIFENDTSF